MKAIKENGSWSIDGKVLIDGKYKHIHRRGFRTQSEAKAEIERLTSDMNGGFKDRTVDDAADSFLAFRKNAVSSSSFLNHEVPMMRKYIQPFFVGKCRKAFTAKATGEFYSSLLDLPYDAEHKNKIILLLHRFADWLYRMALISPDQFSLIMFSCPRIKKEVRPPKKRRAFTDAEVEMFMATCEIGSRDWVMFTLLFSTGLRVGEFLALTPSDFDAGSCSFFVDKQMVYERAGKPVITSRLKSPNSYRRVFVKKEVFDAVMSWVEDMGVSPTDTLFGINRTTFARAFNKHVALAGLGDGLSCHSVRHYVATRLSAQCATIADHEAVASMMGHTPSVDLNVYASHIDVDHLRSMVNKA